MKHWRFTAVILTLALLLGIMPMALAGASESTDTFCSATTSGQHSWHDWTTTVAPTCTRDGSRSHTCGRCGYTQTETLKMTGHKWGGWKTTKEATCTKKGEQARKCSVCGQKETRGIDKKAHTWGEWTVTMEPTDFTMGTKVHTCKVCGTEKSANFYPEPTYKKGDKGEGVKDLQEKLNAAGYDCGKADGDFGKKTEAAVKALEAANGFTTDGIAWPGVQKWLSGPGEYGWEPPEVEEEPEEPDETEEPEVPEEPGGPAGKVSPASIEPSEHYDVTVTVEDTTGLKYTMDPVEVQITFTNTGSITVDVCCKGEGSEYSIWPESALVACTVGELKKTASGSRWEAQLEPSQSGTVTVKVSMKEKDLDKEWIERKLDAWFQPLEASDGYYPGDWPWGLEPRDLDVSFKIGLGDPALKVEAYGNKSTRVGRTNEIGIAAPNYGPYSLYDYEVDVYEWDKDAEDYVFIETIGPLDQIRCPRPLSPNDHDYRFLGLHKDIEVTEQTVADSDNGIIKIAFRARSWTKDGTSVESELQMKEYFVYNAGVHLEAEDTSASQIPEDGEVKVKLTATNIGTEIMHHYVLYCNMDESHSVFSDYHFQDYNETLDWLTPGTSVDQDLRIKVYDEDLKAGSVHRFVSMEFFRFSGEGEKTLPPDTPVGGDWAHSDYEFYTNDVEIVIPLLKESDHPQVTPQPAPQSPVYCAPELIGLGDGIAQWSLTRCAEHYAVAKAANKLLEEAEDDETRLAAWEAVVELWTDALSAEYGAMLAEADRAEKAMIEAEKTAFEAQLMARQAALAFEIPDPAQVDEEIAELLMQKTSELCYERHTAPEPRTDLRATVSGALLDAGEDLRCGQFTHEIGTTLLVTKTLCPEHRAIDAIADDANNAEGWKQVKQAWLDALNAETDARYLAADEAGREIIAAEREAYGEWLEARGALLNRLYPDQPAVVQEVLAETIRARVLEECGD